ncbi:MAG: hypothetical protein Ct9H90mP27_3440 [Gammaproteobacteria bacterium]|nr:MAG: hypothetical protein Ct9H90mP27_3440 [Gammaproteobacteria bacterium]
MYFGSGHCWLVSSNRFSQAGSKVTVVERSTPGPGPESFGIDVRSVAITPDKKGFFGLLLTFGKKR